jgi:hypothetical protein
MNANISKQSRINSPTYNPPVGSPAFFAANCSKEADRTKVRRPILTTSISFALISWYSFVRPIPNDRITSSTDTSNRSGSGWLLGACRGTSHRTTGLLPSIVVVMLFCRNSRSRNPKYARFCSVMERYATRPSSTITRTVRSGSGFSASGLIQSFGSQTTRESIHYHIDLVEQLFETDGNHPFRLHH